MRRILLTILLSASIILCCGFVSTNVPLDHWSYDAIERFIGQELIKSSMMSTKPITRLEMARLITEASENLEKLSQKNKINLAILERLKKEFRSELFATGLLDGHYFGTFVKPVEDPYVRYIFANKQPTLENQRGDIFNRQSNYRAGFATRIQIFQTAAFYIHPEYQDSSSNHNGEIELIEAYGKIAFDNIEVEIGKDSLWWGPGYEGSILMSNNAEPFKLIKISNPFPMRLPWIFRGLGPFKAVWFLTELDENRVVPHVRLTGLRLNLKPSPQLDIGISRVIMFGGQGQPHVGLRDYIKMFSLGPEQAQNNQLAGFDVSTLIPLNGKMPVKSVKIYLDMAGEDEAGGYPTKWGKLFGIQLNDILRTGRTDLRIEYADNIISGHSDIFYNHSLYQSGYTYKGRIIGHHMGVDAHDLFIRLTHYLTENLILGIEYDREVGRRVWQAASTPRQMTDQFSFDLTLFTEKNWQLKAGYRYENTENNPLAAGQRRENHIFQFNLIREF